MPLPLLAVIAAIPIVGGALKGLVESYPPLWTAYTKWALSTWPNVIPTVQELIKTRYMGEITEAEFYTQCEQNGVNKQHASILYRSARTLLTAADYISLWRRGELSESECDQLLSQMQLTPEEIQRAKTATEYVPGVQDVIRFAVREVYSPAVAAKFGQFEDLPSEFLAAAAKSGLSAETAKQYWAAHWELPSVSQGYEMFQRRIIDGETLSMLLRSQDVMPFWRDKLVKAAYNPLTRVDVRRMYNMGVLTEDEVYNAYLDVGYSPENAQRLTTFTTMDTTDEVENLPLSALKKAYKEGLLTVEDLKAGMKHLNYSESVIAFWVTLIEYEKRDKELDELSRELKAQYQAGIIDISEVRKTLESVDAPSNYINYQIANLQKGKAAKVKLPTLADLRDWLRLGMIQDTEFIARALKLGYSREDTEMYLSEIAHTTDTTKIKYLPQQTYARWYKTGLLTELRYRAVLTAMNIRKEDIEVAVQEGKQSQQQGGSA